MGACEVAPFHIQKSSKGQLLHAASKKQALSTKAPFLVAII